MELPPPPVCPDAVFLIEPFAFAIYFQTGAVDEEMDGFRAVNVLWKCCQPPSPTAQRRVIRYGNGDAEHIGD
jgi:hypothetical protein